MVAAPTPSAKDDLAQELGAEDSTVSLVAVACSSRSSRPIAEELFFRGFLFGALRPRRWTGSPPRSSPGSSSARIHAGGTPAIFLVPLAVLGALLCVLYRRTGSLLPGMGVHAFNNALALGVSLQWSCRGGARWPSCSRP